MNKIKIAFLSLVLLFVGLAAKAQDSIPKVKTQKSFKLDPHKKYILGGISVKGNNKFSDESIIIFSELIVGQTIKLPGDKLTSSIKKLWKSDLFSNVDIYVTNIKGGTAYLEIDVKELSKISSVTYKGVSKSKAEDFEKDTKFKKGAMLTKNLINTTRNYIKKKYQDKGFLKAKVSITTKPDTIGKNTKTALVSVDKGEKVKIKNLRFHGNEAFTSSKLKKLMKKTKQKNLFHIFKPSKFIKDKYTTDIDNVIEAYNEKGYRDAQYLSDSISWNKDNTINLDVKLKEGKKYYFGDIKFLGNTIYTDAQLGQFLKLQKGSTYNGKLLKERVSGNGKPDSEDLQSTYLNNGYLFARITPVETRVKNDSINIEIRIHEDDPATVKRISVHGNLKTNDHVIYRELRTLPGNLFSKQDIIRSIREISQLGFFDAEKITPDVKPNYQDKTVDINYGVAEKGSSQIQLQGGIGGGQFVGTLGLKFNNFSIQNIFNKKAYRPLPMGDGQSLSLNLQASKFYSTYSFSFTEPWLNGRRPKSLSFSIYKSNQYRSDYTSNEVNRDQKLTITGGSIGLAQRLKWPDDYFTLSTSLSYQQYHLQDFPLSTFSFSTGYSNNLALAIYLGRNSSGPNPIFPTQGSNFTIGFKFTPPYSSISGEDFSNATQEEKLKYLEYYKISYKGRWFTSLFGKLVMMNNIEFGFLGDYNKDIGVSPFERFYVGGDGMATGQFDSRETIGLRGYPNASLSPTFGGTIYNKFTLELRYPLTLKPSASIYALSFLEGGNSYDGFSNFSPFQLKRSAGSGIRIFMPAFGMLGIDFGYGFDNIPGTFKKSGWQTHFIIGQQF